MGYFSWKTAVTKKSIPVNYDGIVVVLPDNSVKYGLYDGYGNILDRDSDEEEDIFVLYGRFINKNITRDECFDDGIYEKINSMIKIVESEYFEKYKPKYEDLPNSERCEYQGFFYPNGFKNILKKGV